jgi:hypothetical protein
MCAYPELVVVVDFDLFLNGVAAPRQEQTKCRGQHAEIFVLARTIFARKDPPEAATVAIFKILLG